MKTCPGVPVPLLGGPAAGGVGVPVFDGCGLAPPVPAAVLEEAGAEGPPSPGGEGVHEAVARASSTATVTHAARGRVLVPGVVMAFRLIVSGFLVDRGRGTAGPLDTLCHRRIIVAPIAA